MDEFARRVLFLPDGASTFADRVDHLHYFVITTTMLVSLLVGGTALYFFVRYRRRTEQQATFKIKEPLAVEAAFIVVPTVFFLAWFGIGYRDFVFLQNPPANAMDVYVMGKQWMWKFSYPDGPNSAEVLRVPAQRPVRLLLTSRDVIHSFYVPEFRIKQDALPGRYTATWFEATKPGSYQVLCTEYCGADHSMMRATIVVMEPDDFDSWLAEQRDSTYAARTDTPPATEPPSADLAKVGERVAVAKGCLRCHSTDGAVHIGPTWMDLYRRQVMLITGQQLVADEAYLTRSMMDPNADLVAGYAPVMPPYQGLLTPADTAALVEFIKSLRSDPLRPNPGGMP